MGVAKELDSEERRHDAVGDRAGAGASIVWEKPTEVVERGEEGGGTNEEGGEEGACSDRGAGHDRKAGWRGKGVKECIRRNL